MYLNHFRRTFLSESDIKGGHRKGRVRGYISWKLLQVSGELLVNASQKYQRSVAGVVLQAGVASAIPRGCGHTAVVSVRFA